MRKKGTHTWDLHLRYHLCPKCENIIESRTDFVYQLGEYVKELDCPRCHHHFQLKKNRESMPIGPLFGPPQPPEFDWR